MGGVIGLDVGGANTKAVWRNGDERRAGPAPVRGMARPRGTHGGAARRGRRAWRGEPVEAVALTTTAELSDAFRTKREGVGFVLDAVEAAFGGPLLFAFTTAGELVSRSREARARAPEVAAANWVASALAVARGAPGRADDRRRQHDRRRRSRSPAGRVAAAGRTDLDRLLAGELVYTGALRTNLAAIAAAGAGPRRLVPGRLGAVRDQRRRAPDPRPPRARGLHVPDPGRAARRRVDCARERVARLVCSDAEQLGRRGDRRDRRVPPRRAGRARSRRRPARSAAASDDGRRSSRSARGRSSPARRPGNSGSRSPSCPGALPSATRRPPPRSPSSWPRRLRPQC